jgi:molecular chaperone GrpE
VTAPRAGAGEERDRVVIRDKRKIDPVTGEPRPADLTETPGEPPEPAAEAGQAPMVEASLLDERTRDLQRVQAEYANYRKRAEREKLAAGDAAISRVLTEMLPILDDIDRARDHGDLTGALKAVADHLDVIFGKLGLDSFGDAGDPFDPNVHEAVLHNESDEVQEPTCTTVLRRGYRHGERLLRAAMVGVTDPLTAPVSGSAEAEPQSTEAAEEGEPGTEDE